MIFFKKLTKAEKMIMFYMQRSLNGGTENNYFVHIFQSVELDEEKTKKALKKLMKKKFVNEKINKSPNKEHRKIFGNYYRLTYDGSQYKTHSKWKIPAGIVAFIATLAAILGIIDYFS